MKTRQAPGAKRTKLTAAFDRRLSHHLQTLRREVDRVRPTAQGRESLEALKDTVARLRVALAKVSRRRTGDLAERLEELEYPFAILEGFFTRKKASLDRRATEIMAEYLRDRLLEVRIMAKSLDARD